MYTIKEFFNYSAFESMLNCRPQSNLADQGDHRVLNQIIFRLLNLAVLHFNKCVSKSKL